MDDQQPQPNPPQPPRPAGMPPADGSPANYNPGGEHIKPVDPTLLDLFEHDPDEQLICQINKHPIGVMLIWIVTGMVFLVIIVLTYIILRFAPDIGLDSSSFRIGITIFLALLSFLILVGGYIQAWVYQRSVLIVTSEKIVQLIQRNLFDRKISQLSIGDIQDVSVDQRGIIARIFKYGTIDVETAGEQANYKFEFVPFPYECGKEIVGAHERNLKQYGN